MDGACRADHAVRGNAAMSPAGRRHESRGRRCRWRRSSSLHSMRAAEVGPEIIVTLPSSLRRNLTGRGSAAVPGPSSICAHRQDMACPERICRPRRLRGAEPSKRANEPRFSGTLYIERSKMQLRQRRLRSWCHFRACVSHRVQARSDAQQLAIDARSYMRRFDRAPIRLFFYSG